MKTKICLLSLSLLLSATPAAFAHNSDWSYEAPAEWGNLKSDYHTCNNGASQSPVDISQTVKGQLPPLTLSYLAKQKSIVNNGHTVQINVQDGDKITIDGEAFTLRQFHFHTPGEHRISGKIYPLEAHFVHTSEEGHLAVVAVMFEAGAENTALREILAEIPDGIDNEVRLQQPLSLATLMPADKSYYRFSGSLTTPPCTEGVRWLVLKHPVTASESQLKDLASVLGEHGNSRPTQPLNARVIIE